MNAACELKTFMLITFGFGSIAEKKITLRAMMKANRRNFSIKAIWSNARGDLSAGRYRFYRPLAVQWRRHLSAPGQG